MHLSTPRRALAAAAAAALLATATGGAATAAEGDGGLQPAIGATSGATTILGLDGGDLLDLRLLGEDGDAARDEVTGIAGALTRLVPLDIASGVVPDLGAASVPAIEARSTEGEDRVETGSVSLGEGLPAGLGDLLGGTLDPASLVAAVSADGALGALSSTTSGLSVLGGLLELDEALAGLMSVVTTDEATAARGLLVEDLTVLDLTGFLGLLGIDLADLSLDQLLGIVDGLGLLDALGIEGLTSLEDLTGLVDGLLDLLGVDPGDLLAGCDEIIDPILGIVLGINCAALGLLDPGQALTDLTELVDGVLDELLGLIDGVVETLELAPLLHVSSIEADLVASAAGTLEDSLADVVADVGDITVGGLVVEGLDVGATLDQVTALVGQVEGTLDGVLAPLGLAGVIDIGLLESTTGVEDVDGVITAAAELTGLRVTITPPDLCELLGGLLAQDSLGDVLGGLEVPLPDLDPVGGVLGELGSILTCDLVTPQGGATAAGLDLVDGTVSALLEPLTVRAAQVSGTSTFATGAVPVVPEQPAAPAAPAQPVLPRTGGGEAWLLLGTLAAAGGLGARRLLRGTQG